MSAIAPPVVALVERWRVLACRVKVMRNSIGIRISAAGASMANRSCRQCSLHFEITREWQAFCGNKCKTAWHRENSHCFYCGAYGASDRDHIYPVALLGRRVFDGKETVKSCADCNSALGDKPLELEDRVDFLTRYVAKKYRLHEKAVQWGEGEIAELGPILRRKIKRFLAKRKQGEERVLYLKYLAEHLASDDR